MEEEDLPVLAESPPPSDPFAEVFGEAEIEESTSEFSDPYHDYMDEERSDELKSEWDAGDLPELDESSGADAEEASPRKFLTEDADDFINAGLPDDED